MGALSISPSPITIVPFISILLSSFLISSTAALSAAILSFLPLNIEAPYAPLSVVFTKDLIKDLSMVISNNLKYQPNNFIKLLNIIFSTRGESLELSKIIYRLLLVLAILINAFCTLL